VSSELAGLARARSDRLGQPRADPSRGGEAAVADYVVGWLARAGLDVDVVEPVPAAVGGSPSRADGGGRTLLLNAHLDTVGTEAMESPFEARVEDAVVRPRLVRHEGRARGGDARDQDAAA